MLRSVVVSKTSPSPCRVLTIPHNIRTRDHTDPLSCNVTITSFSRSQFRGEESTINQRYFAVTDFQDYTFSSLAHGRILQVIQLFSTK